MLFPKTEKDRNRRLRVLSSVTTTVWISMKIAFGSPGIESRWTHGDKDGIGTAYNSSSRVWFTVWHGIVTETYYPTVDHPQIRDLQFLITDGSTFFHEEKRNLQCQCTRSESDVPIYLVTQSDPEGRYRLEKEILSNPHLGVILQHVRIIRSKSYGGPLRLYVLCAPHLDVGGSHNTGQIIEINGRKILEAERNGYFMTISASVPFTKASAGYVGSSDGWTDIHSNMQMTMEFDSAPDGNIALCGEIPEDTNEFVLAMSFGNTIHAAATKMFESLNEDFDLTKEKFREQWKRAFSKILDLSPYSSDGGELFRTSYGVLMTHEDKTYEGALIASLSIPWGEASHDDNRGGYHLVWPRDMYNSSTAVMACGNLDLPMRTLIYLSVAQSEDGGFPQNFWIDGEKYWKGIQLDETSFPVILAWRLLRETSLKSFDPMPMVRKASKYLVVNGPATQEERWEETSGYSPSTLAANITALICASDLIEKGGDSPSAEYLSEYADFLYNHIEDWTVTQNGTLLKGVRRHFIRILPRSVEDASASEDPDDLYMDIANRKPGDENRFPAREIVDGGFLELVRYGIYPPDNQVIKDSLKVIDSVLKVETPMGPCWRRYNYDGYGQRDDGAPFVGWGVGRAWPLLTGERGHYEIAAGRKGETFERALVKFSGDAKLLPEQVWDKPDLPQKHLYFGGCTGSARPLAWAHAEYIKLLRSMRDGKPFDLIEPVLERYQGKKYSVRNLEIWKFNRMPQRVNSGTDLRIQAVPRFRLHWSPDEWSTIYDTDSTEISLGLNYADINLSKMKGRSMVFTFYWMSSMKWEGKDFRINID